MLRDVAAIYVAHMGGGVEPVRYAAAVRLKVSSSRCADGSVVIPRGLLGSGHLRLSRRPGDLPL